MKALVLALAALGGAPPVPATPPWTILPAMPWDGASEPAASSAEQPAEDAETLDALPAHAAFEGCELTLGGSVSPDAWWRELWIGAPLARVAENGHTEKDGQWVVYDQIARRADRPEAYAAYRYPIADAQVVSGYDLDKLDELQRRGAMKAVGHGGVDIVAPLGTVITMVRLDHQRGDAEVLYAGPLFGETVVTRHVVREGGRDRDYLLLFAHLDRAGDDVRRGRRLREGATVGYVGNTDSPNLVHLHLEARRVRDAVDSWKLLGWSMDAREFSVVTDPRNVLPLRSPPMRASRCALRAPRPKRSYWLGGEMTLALDAVEK